MLTDRPGETLRPKTRRTTSGPSDAPSVYCNRGRWLLTNTDTGETFTIAPGTCYALDKHDRHTLRADEEMKLVCVFNPPVTGTEIHDEDEAYRLLEGD